MSLVRPERRPVRRPRPRPAGGRSHDPLRLGILCRRELCGDCLHGLFLGSLPGAEIRVAHRATALAAAFGSTRPDVIVYSVINPYSVDLPALRALCVSTAPVPILVHVDLPDTALVRDLLRHGARGVLPTATTAKAAAAIVQLVAAGEAYEPPADAGTRPGDDRAPPLRRLTERQLAVLRLTVEGLTNKEIGRALGVGENTIKFHVTGLMEKLGVPNRVRLAVVASRLLEADA